MRLAIDPEKHLIQVPVPLRKPPTMKASFSDCGGEYRSEPVAPDPNRLVADIDTPPGQEDLNLPQRRRVAVMHRRREAEQL